MHFFSFQYLLPNGALTRLQLRKPLTRPDTTCGKITCRKQGDNLAISQVFVLRKALEFPKKFIRGAYVV
jgi:hypothetical protein